MFNQQPQGQAVLWWLGGCNPPDAGAGIVTQCRRQTQAHIGKPAFQVGTTGGSARVCTSHANPGSVRLGYTSDGRRSLPAKAFG